MSLRQSLFTLPIAMLGVCFLPSVARAINLSLLSSETELKTLLPNPAFVAEGQIGNIALKGDFESDIDGSKVAEADFTWSNGEKQPFSLTYDGSLVSYTVGKETLEYGIAGSFKNLFIYAKATEAGTTTLLDSLLLEDSSMTLSISGIAATGTSGGLNIYHIYDIGESFTLIGNATLSWTDKPMKTSNLAYQIHVGNVDSSRNYGNKDDDMESTKTVPEPSTVLGLTLCTGILAFYKRRW